MKHYIFVIDGEVVGRVPPVVFPEGSEIQEKYEAIMESDPKIIPSDEDILEGYLWDGTNFTPPA
jgi:hypothetical protein